MLWNYLCGYVIIQINGLGLERFVNRALASGIAIGDVTREEDGSMTARVDVGGFYALHRLLKNERWSVHIRRKRGIIMRLSKLRRRKVLLYGWMPVLFLLLWASRMIWLIDIDGCDEVSEDAILETLAEAGISPGTKRRSFTLEMLNDAIRSSDPRIALASVTVSGVVLNVEIREADEIEKNTDEDAPADIVAKKDGLILSVTALRGHGKVKPGQTVRAGELLISGNLTREGGEELLVRAKGKVTAETVYASQVVMPTKEEALRLAEKLAFEKVEHEAVIIEKSSRLSVAETGGFKAAVVITAREDIAKTIELE